jgi:phage repressor protein C with HTH and peptisase S24 domain
MRDLSCFDELDEEQIDLLELLPQDLAAKGREMGGVRLIESLENGLSHFLRISDRNSIAFAGGAQATADRLFEEHVDFTVRPFVSHLPLYRLRAAATKFGEFMDAGEEGWVRVPEKLHPGAGMFVARVVGRSMEPRIPDGSLCVFRAPVVGSRRGRLLLIEMLDVDDASQRYTVKKYARAGELRAGELMEEGGERDGPIRLEPLNKEFEAFDLTSDQYRVVAEFVQVLPS